VKKCLVTGSSGLIGSEVVACFSAQGWKVHGLDNNVRGDFFGPQGDTIWNRKRLEQEFPEFRHHELDIRDRQNLAEAVREIAPSIRPRSRAMTSQHYGRSTILMSTQSAR
jgi:CDP-paratose 2-epimerase